VDLQDTGNDDKGCGRIDVGEGAQVSGGGGAGADDCDGVRGGEGEGGCDLLSCDGGCGGGAHVGQCFRCHVPLQVAAGSEHLRGEEDDDQSC
jgi:hypothetical protein